MNGGTNEAAGARTTGAHLLHVPSMRAEALRYVLAGALVLALGGAAVLLPRAAPETEDASEVDDAVLIDLPPALASSEPKREAADGPEQAASQASAATSAPPPVDPPTPVRDPTPPAPAQPPIDTPPPPPAPDPAVALDAGKVEVTPPEAASAAAAPEQEEQAPAGSDQPVKVPDAAGEDEQPHASARAMSLWQRSMVSRLETSKRALRRQANREGTVVVAFAITRAGGLRSARVMRGSGDPALDAVAKSLVERAAPFPAPPAGADGDALSFTVPIRFKR